tara:strand:+ start:28510 stop:29664 length:1155 start_codon:yes stop_codon:yes gene_type:complete
MTYRTVLFWCPFISKVGTINAVIESAKALNSSNKFRCKIINVFGEFDDYSNIFSKNQIKLIKLTNFKFINYLPKKGFFWSRLNYLLIIFLSIVPLYLYLKKNQNNILFTYLLTSLPLFLVKFFNFKNKIIFRISGKIHYTLIRKMILSYSRDKIFKVLIQTKFSRKKLIEQKIYKKKQILYLEDPIIDLQKINKLKKKKIEKKFSNKKFYVAIGRLTKQKNFKFLIDSVKEILIKKKIFLIILGDGEQKDILLKIIKINQLENRIFLLGFKKNIYQYLSRSSGLICTSLWEEPGFVIQEAAACKKIILTSNCESGPAEFLNGRENGYIFKSNDKESFIKKFNLMIREKDKHFKKIQNNYIKSKKYTKKYFAKKIFDEIHLSENV